MSASLQNQEHLSALFKPARPRARRIDRTLVANMLAEGRTVEEVAKAAGCTRQHVWRITRRSLPMQRAIAEAEGLVGGDAHHRLNGLRPRLTEALAREVDAGNVRVMLWLADRLDVAAPPAPPPKMSYGEYLTFANRRDQARRDAEDEKRRAAMEAGGEGFDDEPCEDDETAAAEA